MPLVHHARRALSQRDAGNPFATGTYLESILDELCAAYLDPHTPDRVNRLLKVEIDRIESVL